MKTDLQYLREAVHYVINSTDQTNDVTRLILAALQCVCDKADLEKTRDLMNIELKSREES